jgi:predicted HD phosphohydrolase
MTEDMMAGVRIATGTLPTSRLSCKEGGADDETVLATLLHDIGHFIPMYAEMPMLIAPNGSRVGRKSHDHFGETYLRELGFCDKICQLVGADGREVSHCHRRDLLRHIE